MTPERVTAHPNYLKLLEFGGPSETKYKPGSLANSRMNISIFKRFEAVTDIGERYPIL
jgi:hypothetical protein